MEPEISWKFCFYYRQSAAHISIKLSKHIVELELNTEWGNIMILMNRIHWSIRPGKKTGFFIPDNGIINGILMQKMLLEKNVCGWRMFYIHFS